MGKRDDHALDLEAIDDLRKAIRPAENREMLREVGTPHLRSGVNEADNVGAVLRMLDELAADQLADVPCADDHCVLLICPGPSAGSPGNGASKGNEAQGEG